MGQEETRLTVRGMTCINCVGHVTRALEGVPGVRRADVALEGTVSVRARRGVDVASLVAAVREAGYEASPTQD